MNPKEQLLLDLARLLYQSTWEKSYLTTRELAELIFIDRKDASQIAEDINELEKIPF
jgi:hypothetical protein